VTKREREQISKMLRCAADEWHARGCGLGSAAAGMGHSQSLLHHAAHAIWDQTCTRVQSRAFGLTGVTYADVCLEAAQLVKEGDFA
jgi:hypothetical protein